MRRSNAGDDEYGEDRDGRCTTEKRRTIKAWSRLGRRMVAETEGAGRNIACLDGRGRHSRLSR